MNLKCVKCGAVYSYEINRHNCPKCNDVKFSNLFLTEGYPNKEGIELPFKNAFSKNVPSGNTPLRASPELSAAYGIKNLLVKDESYNPYGTHKDRRSEMIVNIALEQGVDKIVCLTAGNAGYSLSRYCYTAGIDYTSLFFPRNTSDARRRTLREWGRAIEIDEERWGGILKYRDFIQIVSEYDLWERGKSWKKIWNVTNTYEPASLIAYKLLAAELASAKPDYIVVPVGSADLFVGLWLGLKEFKMRSKLVGAVPRSGNVFLTAFKTKNDELILDSYDSSSPAEKLVAPYCALLPFTNKIMKEGHTMLEFSSSDLEVARENTMRAGFKCENSALSGFAVLPQLQVKQGEKVVVISTGCGITN